MLHSAWTRKRQWQSNRCFLDGFILGLAVGVLDGSSLGLGEGSLDGFLMGLFEGFLDGFLLGLAKGFLEGFLLGFTEGLMIGAVVLGLRRGATGTGTGAVGFDSAYVSVGFVGDIGAVGWGKWAESVGTIAVGPGGLVVGTGTTGLGRGAAGVGIGKVGFDSRAVGNGIGILGFGTGAVGFDNGFVSVGRAAVGIGAKTKAAGFDGGAMGLGKGAVSVGTVAVGFGKGFAGVWTGSVGLGPGGVCVGTGTKGLGMGAVGVGIGKVGLDSRAIGVGIEPEGLPSTGAVRIGLGKVGLGTGFAGDGTGTVGLCTGAVSVGAEATVGLCTGAESVGAEATGRGTGAASVGNGAAGLSAETVGDRIGVGRLGTGAVGVGIGTVGLGTRALGIWIGTEGLGIGAVSVGNGTTGLGTGTGSGRAGIEAEFLGGGAWGFTMGVASLSTGVLGWRIVTDGIGIAGLNSTLGWPWDKPSNAKANIWPRRKNGVLSVFLPKLYPTTFFLLVWTLVLKTSEWTLKTLLLVFVSASRMEKLGGRILRWFFFFVLSKQPTWNVWLGILIRHFQRINLSGKTLELVFNVNSTAEPQFWFLKRLSQAAMFAVDIRLGVPSFLVIFSCRFTFVSRVHMPIHDKNLRLEILEWSRSIAMQVKAFGKKVVNCEFCKSRKPKIDAKNVAEILILHKFMMFPGIALALVLSRWMVNAATRRQQETKWYDNLLNDLRNLSPWIFAWKTWVIRDCPWDLPSLDLHSNIECFAPPLFMICKPVRSGTKTRALVLFAFFAIKCSGRSEWIAQLITMVKNWRK
jgi:hypothetical protein